MPGDVVPVGLRHIKGGEPMDDVGECSCDDDMLGPPDGCVDEGIPGMPPGPKP